MLKKIKIAVLGATGYTGLDLVNLLSKKNSIGISVKINHCIIVAKDIILVFEKRSTII